MTRRAAGSPAPARPRSLARVRLGAGLLLVALSFGCSGIDPQPVDPPVDPNSPCAVMPAVGSPFAEGFGPVGSDSTLEIATWNVENFAKAGVSTIDRIVTLVNALQIDLYGMAEIADTTEFKNLLARLPAYAGIFSPDVYSFSGYQKTAFVYRKDLLTLNSWRVPPEFKGNSYAFPRPPLEASFTARRGTTTYSFKVIVQHLKALSGADNVARRRAAAVILHDYLDAQTLLDPNANFIVVGDWNDDLGGSLQDNPFQVFLEDSGNYKFLTQSLLGRSDMASYIGNFGNVIDQILVNRAACPEFSPGTITTLRLDAFDSAYASLVSDHRPVVAIFPAFR